MTQNNQTKKRDVELEENADIDEVELNGNTVELPTQLNYLDLHRANTINNNMSFTYTDDEFIVEFRERGDSLEFPRNYYISVGILTNRDKICAETFEYDSLSWALKKFNEVSQKGMSGISVEFN